MWRCTTNTRTAVASSSLAPIVERTSGPALSFVQVTALSPLLQVARKSTYSPYNVPPTPPGWKKPPATHVLPQDNEALLKVFDVPLEYKYQTTLHWRETPAMARRRAERRRLTEIRKRATAYWADLERQEHERLVTERTAQLQADKAKIEQRREQWKTDSIVVRQRAADNEARKKLREAKMLQFATKHRQMLHESRLEFLRAMQEEIHKFDIYDLPHFHKTKNLKYDTYESKMWLKGHA
eukprot:TRINITY_DN3709_c0_g1_i1.p1 TRINITY_DN3709_c0_g1~~TRINITY_DN3709_c0_g1_i1.p1  ORF type:complete len:239 (-),score=40.68 TRINITY_DN3709_c0_g1_i1:100-816(-)